MRGQLAPVESSDSLPSGRAMNISTQTACLEGQLQSTLHHRTAFVQDSSTSTSNPVPCQSSTAN